MGEVAKSKSGKILAIILLASILVISIPQLGYSPSPASQPQDSSGSDSDGSEQSNRLLADPYASPRPVNESAIGFDSAGGAGRTVNLPSSGTNDLPVTLDYGWSGSKLYTSILGLWDRRQWAQNTGFTTGSGNSSPPWYYREYDPGNLDSGGWISGTPTSGQYVYGSLPHPGGGYRTYYADEYSAHNETVYVNRGSVLDAELSLQYYPTFISSFARGEFLVYVKVEGHLVWYTDFKTIYDGGKVGKWNSVTKNIFQDVNGTNTFNMPADQNIMISIGVWYHAALANYNFPASQNRAYFDNVTLTIKTQVKAEQILLRIREPSSGVSSGIASPSWGSGSGTLSGFTIGPAPLQTTYYFDFTSNVTSPATGSFAANATIYVTRQKTATAAFENKGSNIEWSISLATAFQSYGQSFSTTSYTKYYFNVSVPSDWSLTTCQDPSAVSHDIGSEPDNFSLTTIGSKTILRVNVTNIGSYSTPPLFNPYVIHALSDNYVKNLWTQLRTDTSTYVNSTNFYPQNYTKFASYIAGASPISSGVANLTILGPPTYNASPVVLKTITGNVPSNGWANFTVLWNSTHAAGNYSAQVDWVDNALGEAGSLTCEFNVTHRFKLTLVIPGQDDVILKGTIMINPPTTVSVLDYYTNEFATATVKGRANWTSPGRWDDFTTYSAANATYTNITYIPDNLFVDHQYSLAVNASKSYYDPATANNTFWIGAATNINPSYLTVPIYYTESNTFRVKLSDISYTEDGGGGITGATIAIVAESSSNNSLVKWSVRFAADYSQQGSGIYSGWVYVGTVSQSAKAIPPIGTQYTVLFKLSKGTHWQTRFYTMYLAVSSAPCSLNIKSGDGQYVFWGDTAAIKLNYTTAWTYGLYSLPTTPVLNSTSGPSYAPPYVTVNCGGWSGNWSATHLALDADGIYTLYVNTSTFNRPTNDGSGDGTITFPVRLSKTYYYDSSSNLVTVTLHIKRLTTSITGAVQQGGGAITLTNTTSTYPGDTKTVLIWYNDTHTGFSVGVGGASLTYTSSGGNILGSGSLVAVPGRLGLYNLTLTGTLTNQIPGDYVLHVSASKGNYYVARNVDVTLRIFPITSSLQAQNPVASAYYGERVVFLIWFNDTHNYLPISGASLRVSTTPEMSIISPYEVSGIPGLYNLTIPSGQATGTYTINLYSNKTKYEDGALTLTIAINRLPATLTPFTVATDGSRLFQSNGTVQIGGDLAIYLWLNDTYNGMPVPGVETSITYTSDKFGNGWVQEVEGTPGLYVLTVHCPDAGIFTITFSVNAAGYETHTSNFKVIVQSPGGFTIIQLAVMGLGSGGTVLALMLGWVFVRRARIPFVIKKIDESLKLINKGDHEGATPVALKTREECIVGITQERIAAFSRRKPVVGEPEAAPAEKAVEVAVIAAPAAEVEAALKKELKAVEPGKPEEEIEEVEMETLDEELGRLEKIDTGQEVPEGAKQARDVIEEYKKRKKKR
nr:hypothetical protein [Candidatus Njordarchaeota archaeon]